MVLQFLHESFSNDTAFSISIWPDNPPIKTSILSKNLSYLVLVTFCYQCEELHDQCIIDKG
jgi:hypothetical protein